MMNRLRFEPWGAWVRLDKPAALIAVSEEGLRSLGVTRPPTTSGSFPRVSAPIEAHVAVTERCGAGCAGCYMDASPRGQEPPRQTVEDTLDALAEAGVFTVAFGGGEPTTRTDLALLAERARARGLSPVITTSGLGLTADKVDALCAFDQVNVSYDGAGGDYAEVRGFDGSRSAERTIAELASRGQRVGVNVVLTRATWPRLEQTIHRAQSLGAVEAQLLRYKPSGRAASLDYLEKRLHADQVASFGQTLRRLVASFSPRTFSLRIDCALVPFLSADEATVADPSLLTTFGVFGCEAASALVAVKADGRLAPCSFASPSSATIGTFGEDWAAHGELEAYRSAWLSPPEPCASCTLRTVCKGGCKVVSHHLSHGQAPLSPDPECPRVTSWQGEGA